MMIPCVPDCQERSSTCHAKFPKYNAFAKEREQVLKRKQKTTMLYISDATKRKRDRDAKRKNYR